MENFFTMRLATPDDVGAIVDLVNSAYRGDSSRVGWSTEADLLDGVRIDATRLLNAITDPDENAILLHEGEGRLIACVHLQRTGRDCYLGMLTVLPSKQGGGLGRQVMTAAERWAKEHWGSRHMNMTVLVQRPELIAYYERRGYVVTGERKPFPYGDDRWGLPKRDDLAFHVLRKSLTSMT